MRIRVFMGLCAALIIASAGCQVYDASLLDAGVDAGGVDAGDVDAGPCNSRVPPARPDTPDGPDTEEVIFGLRQALLDQIPGEAWREIGLDLDGLCTSAPVYDTECTPPRRAQPPVDGVDGIDNTFGSHLFPLVDLAVMGLQDTARAAQEEGKVPMVRIRGWNGLDDDPRVDVTISNAIYTVNDAGDGTPQPHRVVAFEPVDEVSGERLAFPRWDGTDFGFFRDETFFDGDPDRPLIRDDNAYIVDRWLVARLPARVEILFPADEVGVLVRLTDATAMGRISDDGLTLENAVVSGRWAVWDLLATAENIGVCQGTGQYSILEGQLDTIADIRSLSGTGGPGVTCDAISVAVEFTGTRMLYGGLTPGPPIANVCVDGDGGAPGLDAGVGMDGG